MVVWQRKQEKFFLYKVILNNHNIPAFNLIILRQTFFISIFPFNLHFSLLIVFNANEKQSFKSTLLRLEDWHWSTNVSCVETDMKICHFFFLLFFFSWNRVSWCKKHICHISFYLNILSCFLLQNSLKSIYCAHTILCKGKKKRWDMIDSIKTFREKWTIK